MIKRLAESSGNAVEYKFIGTIMLRITERWSLK